MSIESRSGREFPTDPGRSCVLIRGGAVMRADVGSRPGPRASELAILPADWASEFLLFCQMNPKPCPVLAVTNPGDPIFSTLGVDVDVQDGCSAYKVFRDGIVAGGTDRSFGASGGMIWWRSRSAAPSPSRRPSLRLGCGSGITNRA